jgi:hypothetical protein
MAVLFGDEQRIAAYDQIPTHRRVPGNVGVPALVGIPHIRNRCARVGEE